MPIFVSRFSTGRVAASIFSVYRGVAPVKLSGRALRVLKSATAPNARRIRISARPGGLRAEMARPVLRSRQTRCVRGFRLAGIGQQVAEAQLDPRPPLPAHLQLPRTHVPKLPGPRDLRILPGRVLLPHAGRCQPELGSSAPEPNVMLNVQGDWVVNEKALLWLDLKVSEQQPDRREQVGFRTRRSEETPMPIPKVKLPG